MYPQKSCKLDLKGNLLTNPLSLAFESQGLFYVLGHWYVHSSGDWLGPSPAKGGMKAQGGRYMG